MRPRYYKQRDIFRCGSIAIFNALKWAGGFKGVLRFRQTPYKGWFLTRTSDEKSPPKI